MGLVLGQLGLHVVSDDDPAGIEVVVQGFGLAQELRAEQDVVHVQLLADVAGVAYRDRGFDDDGRLLFCVFRRFTNQSDDGFYCRAVKEVKSAFLYADAPSVVAWRLSLRVLFLASRMNFSM